MKLGISSYTYGWAVGVPGNPPSHPLDENGLLDRAQAHRVKLLQIGDNLPLEAFPSARLERLAKRAADEGVDLEIGARRLTFDRASQYAGIARRIGARMVRFVVDGEEYHPAPKEVVAILRECAPAFTMDGLRIGIENHDRFPAATLRAIIEAVGSESVGICLDTANSLGAGEGLETVLAALDSLTLNLHIKDFHIARAPHGMGFAITGRPAGSGFLNVPDLLRRLAGLERCTSAVLELWTPPEAQLEKTLAKEAAWAQQSIDYLKPHFP